MLRRLLSTMIIGFGAVSCGGGDDDGADPAPCGSGSAACGGRGQAYAPGLSQSGAHVEVALVEALPAPPELFDNRWIIRVTDAAGAPVTNAAVGAAAFMPDHAHGSTKTPVIAALEDGRYDISPLHFMMPGLWEIDITVQAPEGPDQVTFAFCVEG